MPLRSVISVSPGNAVVCVSPSTSRLLIPLDSDRSGPGSPSATPIGTGRLPLTWMFAESGPVGSTRTVSSTVLAVTVTESSSAASPWYSTCSIVNTSTLTANPVTVIPPSGPAAV